MKNKLNRLLRPHMGVYYSVMGVFSGLAVLLEQYWLAGVEALITVIAFFVYAFHRRSRRREIQHLLRRITDRQNGTEGADSPFPTVVIRLFDGKILFVNDAFSYATGYLEGMTEHILGEVLPGFSTDWLAAGKSEYPYDVTVQGRRYRAYGSSVRADDPAGTLLGIIHFADLTELYQVRDEYVRSRPVVSIIMVDNYEELTKNLTEGAISSLDAKINDAITKWTDGYHGLLRRLEKNRFLLPLPVRPPQARASQAGAC